jgi:hypothetical protein
MFKRAWFLAITLFWGTMNVLLWRSEMSLGEDAGTPLPVAAVWERMLTAPDESSMDVYHRGKKLGYIRWMPKVIEEAADVWPEDQDPNAPEGRVKRILGYELLLDGNLALDQGPQRLRFTWQAELDPRQVWRSMHFRLNQRPLAFDVLAEAATETVTVRVGDDPPVFQQTFGLDELSQPQALLGMVALPLPLGPLANLLPAAGKLDPRQVSLGLDWRASSDTLRIGTVRTRVYRLKARVLDKYEVTAVLSRVGEVLRLELPDRVLLLNEALPLLPDDHE